MGDGREGGAAYEHRWPFLVVKTGNLYQINTKEDSRLLEMHRRGNFGAYFETAVTRKRL